MTAPTPALVRPAPTNPPISACELLDGMPAHRVMRFKRIAHLWSVFGGHDSISRVLSANARPWSQSLTRQHVPMFHEGTNNLSQIGLTHASGSLSGRMPSGPPLALFGPSLELTRYAQRKHTDLAPHSGAQFKISCHTSTNLSSFCRLFRPRRLLQRLPAQRHGAAAFRSAASLLELSIVACRETSPAKSALRI